MESSDNNKKFFLDFNENTSSIVKSLLDGMPGGFFAYRASGDEEVLYINQAIPRIFGCDSEKEFRGLTGGTFQGMVHPDDYERVEKSISQQIQNSIYDLDYVEYRIIRRDGSICWVEDYGHFIHTEDNGDIFFVFIEDATERMKERISELENMNDELRNAFIREIQYKKALLYEASVCFEVNLTQDQFIDQILQPEEGKLRDFFQLKDIGKFKTYSDYISFYQKNIDFEIQEKYSSFFDTQRLIRCCEKGELEQTFDCGVTDARGRKCVWHFNVLLGKMSTGDVAALFIVKDITDNITNQNLIKKALWQVKTANKARATFLFHMSHDIRTPLNTIIGYSDLIERNLEDKNKIAEYIKKIRLSSEQLLSIVKESLELTHMESGKASLVETECSLGELLVEVGKTLQEDMDAKALHFSMDESGVHHFAVVADHIRLREILCQILDNAMKYTPPGGNIRLTITEKNIDFPGYGKYLFVVEDDGIGISDEFMENIFEPFKRENNTTESGVLGSGLGLAVVKNMVDMMEGEIRVESEPEKGSRFTVELLLKLQENQEGNEEVSIQDSVQTDSLEGKKVLLVEDNEINMEMAKELLMGQGFVVETARDGSIAVDMVREAGAGYYDVILMDIQMPVMDGHEAARTIRAMEDERLAQIPIIALSANAFAEDYQKSIKAGMDAHCAKPIDIAELQELIRSTLDRRRQKDLA